MQQLASLVMGTAEKRLLRRQGGSFSVTSEFLKYQRMWANALQGLNLATRWGRASVSAAVIYLQVVRRKNLLSVTSLPGKGCLNETKVSVCCFITFCFTKKRERVNQGDCIKTNIAWVLASSTRSQVGHLFYSWASGSFRTLTWLDLQKVFLPKRYWYSS